MEWWDASFAFAGDEDIDALIDEVIQNEEATTKGVIMAVGSGGSNQSPPSCRRATSSLPKTMATLHEADVDPAGIAASRAMVTPGASLAKQTCSSTTAEEAATKVQAIQRGNRARRAQPATQVGGLGGGMPGSGLGIQGHHVRGDNHVHFSEG